MALQGFMRGLLLVVQLNSCSQHAHQPWACFRKKTPSPCVGLIYAASFQLMIYPDEDRRRDKNGQENGNLKRMAGSKLTSPHDIRAKGSLDFSLRSAGVVHGKCMVTCFGKCFHMGPFDPGFSVSRCRPISRFRVITAKCRIGQKRVDEKVDCVEQFFSRLSDLRPCPFEVFTVKPAQVDGDQFWKSPNSNEACPNNVRKFEIQ